MTDGAKQGPGLAELLAVGIGVGIGAGILGYVIGNAVAERRGMERETSNPAVLRVRDIDAFAGPVSCSRTPVDLKLQRYYCDPDGRDGPWATPDSYPDPASAQDSLSLPPPNCAKLVAHVTVRAPATICYGIAAPAFDHCGSGHQVLSRAQSFEFE